MANSEEQNLEPNVMFAGFALNDCVVEVDHNAAKYLRAVHRTALELAIPNYFGAEIGGFWLLAEQLAQLRKLPEFYPVQEAPLVEHVVEAYIHAQLPEISQATEPCENPKGPTVIAG